MTGAPSFAHFTSASSKQDGRITENVAGNEQQFVFVHSVRRQMRQQGAMLLTHIQWKKNPCGPLEPSVAL